MEEGFSIAERATDAYALSYKRIESNFTRLIQEGGTVKMGPRYHTITSHNIPLTIHQTTITSTSEDGKLIKHYYLIATDNNSNTIVGHRTGQITTYPNLEDPHTPMGGVDHTMIITGIRGQGIATSLEDAHSFFLQQEANQLQIPLTWKAINANLVTLGREVKDMIEHPSLRKIRRIISAYQEQQRWQSIWGDNGSMRMENNIRTFYPNTEPINTQRDIWLVR